MMKICIKCKIEKPATKEFFPTNNSHKDGMENTCKECRAIAKRKWREDNMERVLEHQKNYRDTNKDKRIKIRNKYYTENIDILRKKGREWRKNNREYCNTSKHRYRARKRSLPHTLTVEQWNAVVDHFGGVCAYCGADEKLTQEHFIPVSKNGEYTKNNILPACGSCNSSKCDHDFGDWYPQQTFYDENRELRILEFLSN